jgi:hypothetical protein
MRSTLTILVFCVSCFGVQAQKADKKNTANLVYADTQGVLRYTANNREAAFFGVNYTAPFAYAYRAHKALGMDLEKAIQQDVYHLARLGLDAFRVHVWDTEISDTLGNLIENEHLRLFDFLLAELKKRHIRTIITPIAFWGNGYPEKDENTPGFSRKYGKGKATVNEEAIKAQENYIKQLFAHVNPYTKSSYVNDPDVIAVELNNEPSHSGPKSGVTDYINRLAAALKGTGWTKPVYYNISQSPYYADAVAKANIDGVSFQWYPTGLVANREATGNYLPNVDRYTIPYDTIPEYRSKTKMVYEFDAADVLQSCMYPAMARSFRGAGFQWATQFAYDPTALAYANTEYQTHYLNLAYTPSKAVSLLIACKAFHRLPRLKNYGVYPVDSVFDIFRVSYKEQLSEMNAEQEFYYSNSTTTKPMNAARLQHLAGVGNSPVVRYGGSGAYFLDRLDNGAWRLEVMPDAISVRDPFDHTSPEKEVTRIEWKANSIKISLNDLGTHFLITGLNAGNVYSGKSNDGSFTIMPGTYLLLRMGKNFSREKYNLNGIGLDEFAAPQPVFTGPYSRRGSDGEVSPNRSSTNGELELFNATADRGGERYYPVFRRGFQAKYVAGAEAGQWILQQTAADLSSTRLMGFQYVFAHKLKGGMASDLDAYHTITVRARTGNEQPVSAKITLTNDLGQSFSSSFVLTKEMKDIVLPLDRFTPDSGLVMPRPYPDFLPLFFKAGGNAGVPHLYGLEKLEITIGGGLTDSELKKPFSLEVQSVSAQKNKQ